MRPKSYTKFLVPADIRLSHRLPSLQRKIKKLMQVKEVKAITFIYFRTEAIVSTLQNFLPVSKDLFREAVTHNLQITGPVHWHYFVFSMDESKPFILEVALPVSEVLSEYDGKFHFKRTEPFKCVSVIHEGALE